MTQITLTESKKEELAQKYIDYICKRHGLDQESRKAQVIYFAYMHGINNCLAELNRKENVVMTQYIDKDSLIKESEDEKVIRDIKVVLESSATKFFKKEGKMPIWYDRAVAWLEKRGEQKNSFSLPTEGEFPYNNPADTLDGEIENIWEKLSCDNKFTATKDGFHEVAVHFVNWYEKQGEQKQTVIIPRFRVGDVITSTKNSALKYKIKAVGVLNELGEYDYVVEDVTDTDYKGRIYEMSISKVDEWGVVVEQKPAWSEDDKAVLDALILRLEGDNVYVSPKLAAECLKSLKERVQTQPKQERSEEDKEMLNSFLHKLDVCDLLSNKEGIWIKNKLKALNPQNT